MPNWFLQTSDTNHEVKVLSPRGVGMSRVRNVSESYATLDVAKFERTTVQPRTVDLKILFNGRSLPDLHKLRRDVINIIKRDRTAKREAVKLVYTGGNQDLYLSCHYVSGLEFGKPAGFTESPVIRFIAYDPFWKRDGEPTTATLPAQQSIVVANIIQSDNGLWSNMAGGLAGGAIEKLRLAPNGDLYACGSFVTATAGDTLNRVARWDGVTWHPLGYGLDGTCYDITLAPNGDLYACGEFLHASGIQVNGVARWDGTTWHPLGNGLGSAGYCCAIGSDGHLYVGGAFDTVSGVSANSIAKWDGSNWYPLGGGLTKEGGDNCQDITVGPDGNLYATGQFDKAGGQPASFIAKWDDSNWYPLGGGLNGVGFSLDFGPDGNLYIGGAFTVVGGAPANRVARWNGSNWFAVGYGFNSTCYDLFTTDDGLVYASGVFTQADGVTLVDRFAIWNGSVWSPAATNLPENPAVRGLQYHQASNRLYMGFDTTGTATTKAISIITNSGSAKSHPVITFSGPGQLYTLTNHTLNTTIYFDLTLLGGEIATLDTENGLFTSSFRGNILYTVRAVSDLGEWGLLPGDNTVGVFAEDTVVITVTYTERYWSFDGGGQ